MTDNPAGTPPVDLLAIKERLYSASRCSWGPYNPYPVFDDNAALISEVERLRAENAKEKANGRVAFRLAMSYARYLTGEEIAKATAKVEGAQAFVCPPESSLAERTP